MKQLCIGCAIGRRYLADVVQKRHGARSVLARSIKSGQGRKCSQRATCSRRSRAAAAESDQRRRSIDARGRPDSVQRRFEETSRIRNARGSDTPISEVVLKAAVRSASIAAKVRPAAAASIMAGRLSGTIAGNILGGCRSVLAGRHRGGVIGPTPTWFKSVSRPQVRVRTAPRPF